MLHESVTCLLSSIWTLIADPAQWKLLFLKAMGRSHTVLIVIILLSQKHWKMQLSRPTCRRFLNFHHWKISYQSRQADNPTIFLQYYNIWIPRNGGVGKLFLLRSGREGNLPKGYILFTFLQTTRSSYGGLKVVRTLGGILNKCFDVPKGDKYKGAHSLSACLAENYDGLL